MLPSTSLREFLFACPPSTLWNLPSFSVESLFLPHAPNLILLSLSSRCGSRSTWLSPTLRSGQMVLFFFLSEKAALAFFATALSVALRPLFPFRQAQYAQVFPLKSAPFCKLSAGLGSTNKSAETSVEQLMSWQTGSATPALCNSCSLSPLISRIHSSLFWDCSRTVSFKFFDT